MNELISVIINVYNAEKFIKKCLDSIVSQTYQNLEIIIINDGSTDQTLNICQSYDDKRIKIINQENKGLSISRNVGIENANGEYLFFVDIDDFVEKDVIEYLYHLCKEFDTKMATCRPMDIYDYHFTVKNPKEKIKVISSEDMLKKILLSVDRAGTTWNKLMKKELFQEIRFENRIVNDMTTTHKLVIAASKIAYSNQIKYFYLRHQNSITGKNREERSIDLYKAAQERYYYIKERYPNLIENEIGFLDIIILSYLKEGKEIQEFLEKENTLQLSRKLFSIKMIFSKISIKEKIKLVLFRISPRFSKRIIKHYQTMRYEYKM